MGQNAEQASHSTPHVPVSPGDSTSQILTKTEGEQGGEEEFTNEVRNEEETVISYLSEDK